MAGVLSDLLYADDLVLMSETIEGLGNKLRKWKETHESKNLKVNLRKAEVIVTSGIENCNFSKKINFTHVGFAA